MATVGSNCDRKWANRKTGSRCFVPSLAHVSSVCGLVWRTELDLWAPDDGCFLSRLRGSQVTNAKYDRTAQWRLSSVSWFYPNPLLFITRRCRAALTPVRARVLLPPLISTHTLIPYWLLKRDLLLLEYIFWVKKTTNPLDAPLLNQSINIHLLRARHAERMPRKYNIK